MTDQHGDIRQTIQGALDALKRGDRETAQRLAMDASKMKPESEAPWLILASLSNPMDSIQYINKALQINPESRPAQQALGWALEKKIAENDQAGLEKKVEPVIQPVVPVTSLKHVPEEHLTISPPTSRKRNLPSPTRIFIYCLIGLLVLLLVSGLTIFRPQLNDLLARVFPAKGCDPTLSLGANTFEMRTIKPGKDGSLKVPRNHPERAYWVEGTVTSPVFVLNPAPENLSMFTSMKTGEIVTVTWANCNTATYNLSAVSPGDLSGSDLQNQPDSQITIFTPSSSDSSGLVVRGELQGEEILTFNTPDPSEMQAEVSLLETTTSTDGKTLTIGISILNTGQTTITLTTEDVSLTPQSGKASAPLSAEPALPIEIKPGESETFAFTFPKPPTLNATIKVFSVEFELESY